MDRPPLRPLEVLRLIALSEVRFELGKAGVMSIHQNMPRIVPGMQHLPGMEIVLITHDLQDTWFSVFAVKRQPTNVVETVDYVFVLLPLIGRDLSGLGSHGDEFDMVSQWVD